MTKLQKIFLPGFFNILKEPLLVQKQTILQKKGLILSFLELKNLGGVALSGGLHAHFLQKDIEKKSKFDGGKSGSKQIFFKSRQFYSYIMRKVYAH